MTFLHRLRFISSPFNYLAFQRTSSTRGGISSAWPLVKLPTRYLRLWFPVFKAEVDITADSWSSGRKYVSGFEDIEELHNAPEEVKRVFSLQNASQWEHRKIGLGKMEQKYADKYEQKIAKLTIQIEAVKANNNDGRRGRKDIGNKVFLSWLIAQRRKKLLNLKNLRFERYLELIKELDIAPLESPHTKWNKYKFRQFKMGVEIKEKKRPYLRRV